MSDMKPRQVRFFGHFFFLSHVWCKLCWLENLGISLFVYVCCGETHARTYSPHQVVFHVLVLPAFFLKHRLKQQLAFLNALDKKCGRYDLFLHINIKYTKPYSVHSQPAVCKILGMPYQKRMQGKKPE